MTTEVTNERLESLRAVRTALKRAEVFASQYEFDSDEGCHTPNDLERMLMIDMLNGLFDDEEFVSAITQQRRSSVVTEGMVEAALTGWYGGAWPSDSPEETEGMRRDMRTALTAALSSPAGDTRDSLRFLRHFAEMYRSGAQGSEMDCDAAQALALSIDVTLASLVAAEAQVAALTAERDALKEAFEWSLATRNSDD